MMRDFVYRRVPSSLKQDVEVDARTGLQHRHDLQHPLANRDLLRFDFVRLRFDVVFRLEGAAIGLYEIEESDLDLALGFRGRLQPTNHWLRTRPGPGAFARPTRPRLL